MDFEEYQLTGRAKYAAFVEAVRNILTALADKHGFVPHAITGRAKDPASLKIKLALNGIDPASAIEEALKDLAGCRIVFLTNSQVAAFGSTGAIFENFDMVNVNEHHSVPGTDTEERLFDSTNYTVSLKPDRAALPEYQRFAGLKIEIQLQTLLNHAWAEMGHDTIYKEPDLKHVDPRHMASINERMKKVMRQHLLPAGYQFDKIAQDFSRVLKADAAVDETLATIEHSVSNDELLGAFETADTLVLPYIADNREVFAKLMPQIASAVERVRGSQSEPVESIFGTFPGKTGEIVARKAAELIGQGLFVDMQLTFDTLVRLYNGSSGGGERKTWGDLGAKFAEYNLEVWEGLRGPRVQSLVIGAIGKLEPEMRRTARGLILAMIGKILSSEVAGVRRAGFRTVEIATGTVGTGAELQKVRASALDILNALLDEAATDDERAEVLSALWVSTTLPFQGASEEIRIQVMGDVTRVAEMLLDRAPRWGLELRRKTEAKALRVYRNLSAVPAAMAANEELVAAQAKLVPAVLSLRDALNGDDEFVLYKTVVGYDSVVPAAWDEPVRDFAAFRTWRDERFPDIAAEADPEQAEAWAARIRSFLAQAGGGGDGRSLAEFVEKLAELRPSIGAHLLQVMDADLQPVLVRLLHGLDAAGGDELVQQHVARFMGEGRFLFDMSIWLARRGKVDVDLLARVADRARELGDMEAVLEGVNAAGLMYKVSAESRLIDDVFLPSAEYFRGFKDPAWNDRLLDSVETAILEALDEAQSQALIELFVPALEIDYAGDRNLAVIAGRFPALVFDFFGARIASDPHSDPIRFEAVPFHIHELGGVLARDPGQLLAAAQEWYRRDPSFHEHRGGRLIRNVFPKANALYDPLQDIVAKGNRQDLAFVLDTLIAYDGDEEIFPITMDIVERLDPGDDLFKHVSRVHGERGVLTGDFGFVEADRAEHGYLAQWQDDKREKVAAFVKAEMRRIAQSMAREQRRAEGEIEQQKLDWEPDPAGDAAGDETAWL